MAFRLILSAADWRRSISFMTCCIKTGGPRPTSAAIYSMAITLLTSVANHQLMPHVSRMIPLGCLGFQLRPLAVEAFE
jgi:hypothetical protein